MNLNRAGSKTSLFKAPSPFLIILSHMCFIFKSGSCSSMHHTPHPEAKWTVMSFWKLLLNSKETFLGALLPQQTFIPFSLTRHGHKLIIT